MFFVITALITLISIYAIFSSLKAKNLLAAGLSAVSAGVFAWFTIMSVFFPIAAA